MILKKLFPNLLPGLFQGRPSNLPARRVYDVIVAQARQPWFYQDLAVPDTVSGRFDMIGLHAFLVFDRLSQESPETVAFSQQVYDEMFMDMDRSLREMGVGDLAVGKRIRKMAEVFHGRSDAYRRAFGEPDGAVQDALQPVLTRNVFDNATAAGAVPLAQYVVAAHAGLAGQSCGAILAGDFSFAAPAGE